LNNLEDTILNYYRADHLDIFVIRIVRNNIKEGVNLKFDMILQEDKLKLRTSFFNKAFKNDTLVKYYLSQGIVTSDEKVVIDDLQQNVNYLKNSFYSFLVITYQILDRKIRMR